MLIFKFFDINLVTKQNLRITSQVFCKKSQKNLYNYCIKAQKLPMLKQGVKTTNFEFI